MDSCHFKGMKIRPGLEVKILFAFGQVEFKVPLRSKQIFKEVVEYKCLKYKGGNQSLET